MPGMDADELRCYVEFSLSAICPSVACEVELCYEPGSGRQWVEETAQRRLQEQKLKALLSKRNLTDTYLSTIDNREPCELFRKTIRIL